MTKDLTGATYAKLTAVRCIGNRGRFRLWECQCSCGKTTAITVGNWGKTQSCGCAFNAKHDKYNTREYSAWKDMVGRCYNPHLKNYHRYGGRGITVCDEWREDFLRFLSDMGPAGQGLSLDRKDNDGPYSAENCRWATVQTQARNKSTSINITCEGVTKNAADWAVDLGISYSRVRKHFIKTGQLISKGALT